MGCPDATSTETAQNSPRCRRRRPPSSGRIRYRPRLPAVPERGTGCRNDEPGRGGGGGGSGSQIQPLCVSPPFHRRGNVRHGTAQRPGPARRAVCAFWGGGGCPGKSRGGQAPSASPAPSPKSPALLQRPQNAARGRAGVTPPPQIPRQGGGLGAGEGGGGGVSPQPPPSPRLRGCSGSKLFPSAPGFSGKRPRFWVRLRLASPPPKVRHSPGPPPPRCRSRGWRRAKATAPKRTRKREENQKKE